VSVSVAVWLPLILATAALAAFVAALFWPTSSPFPARGGDGEGLSEPHSERLGQATSDLQLGPSLSGGCAGVRRESRPVAGADLTGPLMVRTDGKAAGCVAHAQTGGTSNTTE
jgi:hypothetical protein